MANITTFGTLKSEILAMIGRAPADPVYQIVTQEINEELRLKCMEETTTATEAASVDLSGVSPTVRSIVSIYRDVTPRTWLTPVSAQTLTQLHYTSGNPCHFAFVEDALLLDRPGSGETLNIRYIGDQANFSADGNTNDVLTRHPGIYLYGSLYHHAMGIRDMQAASMWGAQYEKAKKRAVAQDQADKMGPGPVVPVAPGMTP